MDINSKKGVPETVAIVAMGISRKHYLGDCMRCGGRKGVADETWVINKLGDVLKHDMVFRMDDLRKLRDCNDKPGMNKDGMSIDERQNEWMKNHDKPIITSTPYPEYPTSVAYPLEAVINTLNTNYLLTTPAYAIAFAIHIGVKCMKIYGCDFVYKENPYISEQGRGNCEFLLAIAHERGIKIEIAKTSTLLGMNLDIADHLYSYEGVWETFPDPDIEGHTKVAFNAEATKHRQEAQDMMAKQQLEALQKKYPHVDSLKASQDGTTQEESLTGDEKCLNDTPAELPT